MKQWIVILLTGLILAGCSASPPTPPTTSSWEQQQQALHEVQNWTLSGKIGFRTPSDSQSANLKWMQHQQQYQIDIRGPWGQGGASIYGEPGAVTVDASGEGIFRGSSPDALLAEHLGWELPISQFYWWIRGLPAPGGHQNMLLENNRLSQLKQAGWDIEYLTYYDGIPNLPRKLKLHYGKLTILIVIHDWTTGVTPDV